MPGKRVLFILGKKTHSSNAVANEIKKSDPNDQLFILDINPSTTTQCAPHLVKININSFSPDKISTECDLETNDIVRNISNEINHQNWSNKISFHSIPLTSPCETELHIYYIMKVLEQIITAKNILLKLNISDVKVFGDLYNFFSFLHPPHHTTFLWSFIIAAEETGLPTQIFCKQNLLVLRCKLFILSGLIARIGLQYLRRLLKSISERRLLFNIRPSKVVSLCHSRNTSATVNSVSNALNDKGINTLYLYANDDFKEFLPKNNALAYDSCFSLLLMLKCFLKVPFLYQAIVSCLFSNSFKAIRPDSPSFAKMLRFLFMNFSVVRFPAALCYFYISSSVLVKSKANSLLLAMESNARERAIALTAKSNRINSFFVQTGLYNKTDFLHRYSHSSKYVFVDSPYAREAFISFGYHPNHIVISGQPSYIYLKNFVLSISKEFLLKKLGITTAKKILLYAPQCFDYTMTQDQKNTNRRYCAYEKTMLNTYRQLKSLQNKFSFFLIIKPHPREIMELHEKFITDVDLKDALLLDRSYNPYFLFAAITGIISTYSSLVTEALFCGKPAIVLASENKEFKSWPFASCEAAFLVNSKEEFESAIQKVIELKVDWDKKCIDFFNSLTDNHAENAHEFIASYIINAMPK